MMVKSLTFQDFQEYIEVDTNGGWISNRAYSVDLNPAFVGNMFKLLFSFNKDSGGDTVKAKIYESYNIVYKKIIWLDQYNQLIK